MNPVAPEAVRLTNVHKVYAQGKLAVAALNGVSLTIPDGQFVAVMGASGSGKSTLLHLVAGLARATTGDIALYARAISAMSDDELTHFRRTRVGLIFQSFNLLPTLNALENVALPLLINGARLPAARARATTFLDSVGLSDRATHRPDELSGGQQQRVAIARALINEAPLLLADEPTGNLDSQTGAEILRLLRALATEHGRTVVMVTHDPRAAGFADRVITLRDGQVVEERD
ncbi:MAG TPA: ABC transporter ATP-binding protein [Anaerolineae bacterium]|nr:ABC transporter ATP-binding protein [Anaerolineae bacterium]